MISVANGLATAVHVSLAHISVPTATYEQYLFHYVNLPMPHQGTQSFYLA